VFALVGNIRRKRTLYGAHPITHKITIIINSLILFIGAAAALWLIILRNNHTKIKAMVKPNFTQINTDELLKRFRRAATGNPNDARDFFTHLPFVIDYSKKDYLSAFNSAIYILTELKEFDNQAYERIHKGYIFYFMAISAFMMHDYQAATFFFDITAAEDMKNSPGVRTPPLLFLVLDGENPEQAAQELTANAEKWFETMIGKYNDISGSVVLTLDEVRQLFLERAITDHQEWRTLVTSWISFYLEWNHRIHILNLRIEDGTWEPFYLHLFKGCLLFESLLKSEPSGQVTEQTLGQILNNQNSYSRSRIGITRRINTGSATFTDIVSESKSALPGIENDIEVTARLRNTVGHNLGLSASINLDEFNYLANKVSSSCLHAVSTLYR
jgi:hypothetical protein